jgi:hypothetical protein
VARKPFSILVLCFGDHFDLAQRVLGSIETRLPEGRVYVQDIRIALNEACKATRDFAADWSFRVRREHEVSVTRYVSLVNVMKYPLMRRMLYDKKAAPARYVMWFDDDSYLCGDAGWWPKVLSAAEKTDMLGQIWQQPMVGCQWDWVRTQPWYNPAVGKPRTFHNQRCFRFCQGAWWVASFAMLRAYDWPIPALRHCGGDSMLGELMRHQNLQLASFDEGVRINADAAGNHSKAIRRGFTERNIGADFRGDPLSEHHHNFELARIVC